MPQRTTGFLFLFAAVLLLGTTDALAFCRQTSCVETTRVVCPKFEDPNDCVTVEQTCARDEQGCVIDGLPLHRKAPCLSFAVARGNAVSFGLTDEEFAEIVQQAFERWSTADCGGGLKPGFMIQSAGLVTAQGAFYCPEVSLNASTWLLTRPWTRDAALLANNLTTSSAADAEVFDADVELNVDKILTDFPSQNRKEVLLAIATHEAGHFLGLAHSPDPKAVMYEGYSRGLSVRALTQDDIAGICAIFPPSGAPSECAVPGVTAAGLDKNSCAMAMNGTTVGEQSVGASDESGSTRGCSIAPLRREGSGLGAFVVFLLIGWLRRRKLA